MSDIITRVLIAFIGIGAVTSFASDIGADVRANLNTVSSALEQAREMPR
jgi:hypothetical protein